MEIQDLLDHLRAKNPTGIRYSDAVQLFLWLYVAQDLLPERFRAIPLGRSELAWVFQRMTDTGLITEVPSSEVGAGSTNSSMPDWNRLVDQLLLGRVELDDGFRARATLYI